MHRIITGKMDRIAALTDGDDSHVIVDSDHGTLILVARNDYQADGVGLVFYNADKLRALKTFCQAVAAKCDELLNNQPLDK